MKYLLLALALASTTAADSCEAPAPQSASGLSIATVKVPVGPNGLSIEQQNIRDRLLQDNTPGSIKHLYVISAYSGQVLIYSTVRGKVTSGGKRLTPTTVEANRDAYHDGFHVTIGGASYETGEVLQDDGTYGSSGDYLYWWDTRGVYHQHYVQGGQIVHISSEPLNVPHIVINMNTTAGTTDK